MGTLTARVRQASSGALIGVAALAAVVGGGGFVLRAAAAPAATSHVKYYSPGRFLPGDSAVGFAGIGVGSLTCTFSPYVEGTAGFGTPLDLPDGSRVTKVVYYYTDNHASANLTFHLGAAYLSGNETRADDGAPPVSSSGASATATNISIIPASPLSVANAQLDAQISVEFGACDLPENLVFHGAKVTYLL